MILRKNKKGNTKTSLKKTVLKWFIKLSALVFGFFILIILLIYLGLFGKLPSINDLTNIHNFSSSLVYSADGEIIGSYFLQNRRTIDNENISEYVKNALVATEDCRFYEHKGLDLMSMARVFFKNILMGDRSQGGGSTISQQLAKNLYPRNSGWFAGLFIDKIREMFIAYRIEKVFSKEEILGLYLNTVPFGEEIYGIEVAARRFFSKPSSDLSVPESATLVGMLAANTAYNPRRNPEMSTRRRNLVIDRMATQGYLSSEEAEAFKEMPMETNYSRIDYNHGPAPWFIEQVRMQTEKILQETEGGSYNIYTDGLRITTTLDANLQAYAVEAVKDHMAYMQQTFDQHWSRQDPWHQQPEIFYSSLRRSERYINMEEKGIEEAEIIEEMEKPVNTSIYHYQGEKNVSISPIDSLKQALRTLHSGFIAMDPTNGHILAWVGGVDFRYFKYDHVTAKRQVGSTFKPILYGAAINKGFDPCEFISNERRIYEKYNNWSPSNFDGEHNGYYSMKGGLVYSINTIAAELINRLGVKEAIKTAHKLGITSNIPPVPSIALGTAEVSLLEMVTAYTAFPNYGFAIPSQIILKIETNNGEVIYEAAKQPLMGEAFNEETARIMIQLLKEVIEKGTGAALYRRYNLQSEYGGKTGTTQNNADAWFIGFTPTLVAGAWVGAQNPGIHFRPGPLGQGAHAALPIFARFMQKIEKNSKYSFIKSSSFYPLPDDLMARLDCEDFIESMIIEDRRNFFQRLFGIPQTVEPKQLDPVERKEEVIREKDRKLLRRMRDIFRKD